jgi:hypothetical protein
LVRSDFFRDSALQRLLFSSPLGKSFALTPEKGAKPLVRLATVPDAESVNGAYFHRMKRREPKGTSPELAARLWAKSEQLLGIGDQANR